MLFFHISIIFFYLKQAHLISFTLKIFSCKVGFYQLQTFILLKLPPADFYQTEMHVIAKQNVHFL